MKGVAGLLALNGVALLGFGAVLAVAAALAHRPISRWAATLPPPRRARVLVAWAGAPAALAAALLALALWPSAGAALGLAVDHCPAHAGHVHLCLYHLPERGPGVAGALGLAALAALAAATLARGIRSRLLASRLAGARASELPSGAGVVTSRRAFALTVGWLRPAVLVSSALVERLSPRQLAIVVAHERAHAARRDALAGSAARVLSLAHLPGVRREILSELALACEQACDEAAARECGDPVLVAETIVAAERAAAPVSPALAFAGGDVARRVEALLETSVAPRPPRSLRWLALAVAVALGAAAPHVHHWTETLLDRLPR